MGLPACLEDLCPRDRRDFVLGWPVVTPGYSGVCDQQLTPVLSSAGQLLLTLACYIRNLRNRPLFDGVVSTTSTGWEPLC